MDHSKICTIINQVYSINSSIKLKLDSDSLTRKFQRIYRELENMGYTMHDPLGENYDVERVDCEATISGNSSKNLKIVEVIKPIIYLTLSERREILQRGIVIIQGREDSDKIDEE